jgi:excinuclease UvrABC nuclease subunit
MSRVDRTNSVHYVYRCYDADGRLVYVGSTADLFARLEQHRRTSWWAGQVVQVTAKVYSNGVVARQHEREAIRRDQPRWNKAGRWASHSSWTRGQWDDWLTMLLARDAYYNEVKRFLTLYRATWGAEPSEHHMAQVSGLAASHAQRVEAQRRQREQIERRQAEVRRADELSLAAEMAERAALGIPADCICMVDEFNSRQFCVECDAHGLLDQGVL